MKNSLDIDVREKNPELLANNVGEQENVAQSEILNQEVCFAI